MIRGIIIKNIDLELKRINEKNCLLAKKYILEYVNGKNIPNDLEFDISGKIYCFKENFLRFVGETPFTDDIRNYRDGVIDYMRETYPYCLAIGGAIEVFNNMDEALLFYAKSRGASEEQLKQIIPMLKESKIPQIDVESYSVISLSNSQEILSIDKIVGSGLRKYKADNLYDALVAVDDKNIQSFINFLVSRNVFNIFYTRDTMKGICCYMDEDNNIVVVEGNHRVIVLKVLQAIREFVEGKVVAPSFRATIMEVRKQYNLK